METLPLDGQYYEVLLLADKVSEFGEYSIGVSSSTTETVTISALPEYINFEANATELNLTKGDSTMMEMRVGNTPIENKTFAWSSNNSKVSCMRRIYPRKNSPYAFFKAQGEYIFLFCRIF